VKVTLSVSLPPAVNVHVSFLVLVMPIVPGLFTPHTDQFTASELSVGVPTRLIESPSVTGHDEPELNPLHCSTESS
jgi:hypothetical protein